MAELDIFCCRSNNLRYGGQSASGKGHGVKSPVLCAPPCAFCQFNDGLDIHMGFKMVGQPFVIAVAGGRTVQRRGLDVQ